MDVSEDLGTTLIRENDGVRIFEHRVPAGATGPLHIHRRPYLSVVVGTKGDVVDAVGNVIDHDILTPGSTFWIEDHLPETHALHNTGDDEILIVTTVVL
jgi:hypothetical protein